MNIAEVECKTGMARANIRFYEKEGLVSPARSANGYRDYTEQDVETLRKVRLLRRLRLSVPEIRAVKEGERALTETAERQLAVLEQDIREGRQAYVVCRAICDDGAQWSGLNVDKYLSLALHPAALWEHTPAETDRIPPAGCPWRRFFARGLDLLLYGLVWSMLAQWVFRLNPMLYPGLIWTLLCGYAGWALTFIFEPLLLHFWGTTPAKWMLGLSVREEDGRKLSIRGALARTWGVFTLGMGFNVPVYSLYRNWVAYRACTEEELPWDLDNGCAIVVRARQTRWYRVAGYLALGALIMLADTGISLRAELPPNRGEMTLAEYVENCNDYLKYRGLSGRMLPDGSFDPNGNAQGGSVVVNMMDAQITCMAETDQEGYVTAVSVRQEIDGETALMLYDLYTMREMLLYAYGLPHEKMGVLSLNRMPLSSALARHAQGFTESLGSLIVTQQVAYKGYELAGDAPDAPLWPVEDAPVYHYQMEFCIIKNENAELSAAGGQFFCQQTAKKFLCFLEIYRKMVMQFIYACCIINL